MGEANVGEGVLLIEDSDLRIDLLLLYFVDQGKKAKSQREKELLDTKSSYRDISTRSRGTGSTLNDVNVGLEVHGGRTSCVARSSSLETSGFNKVGFTDFKLFHDGRFFGEHLGVDLESVLGGRCPAVIAARLLRQGGSQGHDCQQSRDNAGRKKHDERERVVLLKLLRGLDCEWNCCL